MADPIEVNYIRDGDDWTVTAKGRGQTLTGRAPGLIAARDRADQLVEQLAPDEEHRRVVHLLDGDAVAFTTAYLTARLAKPEPEPEPTEEDPSPANGTAEAEDAPAAEAETPTENENPAETPAPQPEKAEEPASP